MDGLLPVWKPVGMTSFQVTSSFKHALSRIEPGRIRIGHAGTLDPFAEGVLVLMIGKATKQFDEIQKWKKMYRAVARLGASSDTLDVTGKINTIPKFQQPNLTIERVQQAVNRFVGEIEQVVPKYSAAKYKGKPLYKYARKGEETPEKKKVITIYSIEVVRVEKQKIELLIECSSGTYIRQLSYDIFKTLGIESYLEELVRERVGAISRDNCLTFDQATDVDMVAQRVQLTRDELESPAAD